jgi:hypothetical protein
VIWWLTRLMSATGKSDDSSQDGPIGGSNAGF